MQHHGFLSGAGRLIRRGVARIAIYSPPVVVRKMVEKFPTTVAVSALM